GIVYVGTWGGGLLEYETATGRFTNYRASGGVGSLSHDVVYSILRDSSGELWFGTNGGGIDKLSRARRSYGALEASAQAFPKGKVYAIDLDSRGELWVGVYNGGIAVRSKETGAWRSYRKSPGRPRSLPNDIVNFIHEDRFGRMWAGTNDGLARLDPRRGDFDVYRPGPDKARSLSSEVIYAMAEDPEGALWIGTFRSGLDRLDPVTGTVTHFPHDPNEPSSLSDNLVFALEYDSRGRLWVGTNNGLNRLTEKGFVRYLYDPAKRAGISNDSIRTIFRDSLGVLWFGTAGGGLMRYEPETDSFMTYTKKEGLPSNTVVRILEDSQGELWIATQSGLAIYDRKTGTFRGLTVYNDLRDREFYTGAVRGPDGSLYFGALDGIYRFDPGRYEYNTHRPPVVLTYLQSAGRPKPIPVAAPRLRSLELAWRDNSVEFGFAALDFRDPDRNQYAYRLEGFDHDWISAADRRWASYTNLPGGDYVFRVKASNNDGLWNEEGLALPVHVGWRPWTSPLAFVLYAVLVALLASLLSTRATRKALASTKAALVQASLRCNEVGSQLERLEAYDQLTGTLDRRGLEERLEADFARARAARESVAALIVEVDRFSAYNDSRGRQAGDECLRRIAACLIASLERATDSITRYGGAKFLVLIANADVEMATEVAQRLRRSVEALAIAHDGGSGLVTVSIGCAALRPELGLSSAALLASADRALYQAQERGGNAVAS
ncbi:MAG TPA: two-component regulator propeller domain-containing protein, partial [Rectinemataceae bacterium]|nr:two-component regulator propeller domain-containing protein [Rectinemataceae bacterium]